MARVKHTYNLSEIFHIFVNNEIECHTKYTAGVLCMYNYLFAVGGYTGKYMKNRTKSDIENVWNSDNCFAIINREKRVIIIRDCYQYRGNLVAALPEDYTVLYSNKVFHSPFLLRDDHIMEAYHIYVDYLIEHFMKVYLSPIYSLLNNGRKTLHTNINHLFDVRPYKDFVKVSYGDFSDIRNFIKKVGLNKSEYYTQQHLDNDIITIDDYRNCVKTRFIKVKRPSISDFINKRLFTKKELELCTQKFLFTALGYGHGIPLSEFVDNWNKPYDEAWLNNYIKTYRIKEPYKTYVNSPNTIGDALIQIYEASRIAKLERIKRNEELTEANKKKAIEELNDKIKAAGGENLVDLWRNSKFNLQFEATYKAYNQYSDTWETKSVNSKSIVFDNTQLKFENNIIITSRGATVTMTQGVVLFNIIKRYIMTQKDWTNDICINFSDKNIMCGYYKLRHLRYCDKVTDKGDNLNVGKQWCVEIGCHKLWLDDIIDAITYYNKEDLFDLQFINILNYVNNSQNAD